MSFPVVFSTSVNSDGANALNHSGTVPSGNVGDLIIASLEMDGNTTFGWPAGWTVLCAITNSGGDGTLETRYRIADGSEPATIIVTTAGNEAGSFAFYRISNWHGTTPPEAGTPATGSTSDPDPPTVTASWGSDDNLFIVIMGWNASTLNIITYPSSYTVSQITDTANNAAIAGIAMAGRELAGASDDPGLADLGSTNTTWVANTVVVRPVAAGGNVVHPIFADGQVQGVIFGGQVVR